MAMNLGGKGGSVRYQRDALVDVMLVLLIIAMIIAHAAEGHDVKLPTFKHGRQARTQDQTVVAISAAGQLFLDQVEVPEADLARRVIEKLESKKAKVVLIKADEVAPYGRVMVAMDTLRKAQVEDMGLVTERKIKPGQTGGN